MRIALLAFSFLTWAAPVFASDQAADCRSPQTQRQELDGYILVDSTGSSLQLYDMYGMYRATYGVGKLTGTDRASIRSGMFWVSINQGKYDLYEADVRQLVYGQLIGSLELD